MTMEDCSPKPQPHLPLHKHNLLRRATFNRLFMAVHTVGIFSLLYHHIHTLLFTTTTTSTATVSLLLLLSDTILTASWVCSQVGFHLRPIRRQELLQNLENRDFPAVDVFICTADPQKEPPIGTVNTALSVMAYDYPPEKLSVYVSDDGGAQATLFAFVEAAKFARHWLPFCRDNKLVERCPKAYFSGAGYSSSSSPQAHSLKKLYESMKVRVENTVERERPLEEHIEDEEMLQAFAKWTPNFTPQHHPPLIQVLLESMKDKDVNGGMLPNLVYVSREKSKIHPHKYKAGALNALIRVSATMTNAPIVLTLDCDTYSNDPETIKRALCYLLDPEIRPTLAYVQFPQIFGGINRGDIYFSEHKRLFQINPIGMDGLGGPNYVGANCFFQRRAFFGSPTIFIGPEIPELSPNHRSLDRPIGSDDVLKLAHHVATCNYEDQTGWGSKLGFRYGSLVEDYYTGYRLQCEGWRSVFCHPTRPAFLGDAPMTLIDMLGQCKRWMIGLLDVLCCKYNQITFGLPRIGPLGLAYAHYALWPICSIPLTLYAFIPQLALLNGVSIFPKVSDPWFLLYVFIFLGANGKDLLDYLLENGTFERWWNSQRIWMISGVTCFLFGCIEYTLSSLGIAVTGFNVTSKVQDDELKKRYEQGVFEFGVASPMFVTLAMAAIINLVSFAAGLMGILTRGMANMEGLILQIWLCGFVVLNCLPIYEAMLFRSDKGKMPTKTTLFSTFLVAFLYLGVSIFL